MRFHQLLLSLKNNNSESRYLDKHVSERFDEPDLTGKDLASQHITKIAYFLVMLMLKGDVLAVCSKDVYNQLAKLSRGEVPKADQAEFCFFGHRELLDYDISLVQVTSPEEPERVFALLIDSPFETNRLLENVERWSPSAIVVKTNIEQAKALKEKIDGQSEYSLKFWFDYKTWFGGDPGNNRVLIVLTDRSL